MSRRSALRWMAVAAPAVALTGRAVQAAEQAVEGAKTEEKPPKPKLSEDARFVVKSEPGLTGPERKRLQKQLPAFEGALRKLRDFNLPDDVEPAFNFRALRSAGRKR